MIQQNRLMYLLMRAVLSMIIMKKHQQYVLFYFIFYFYCFLKRFHFFFLKNSLCQVVRKKNLLVKLNRNARKPKIPNNNKTIIENKTIFFFFFENKAQPEKLKLNSLFLSKMKAVVRVKYAEKIDDYLDFKDDFPKPKLEKADHVLIKVFAASTNPFDVKAGKGDLLAILFDKIYSDISIRQAGFQSLKIQKNQLLFVKIVLALLLK